MRIADEIEPGEHAYLVDDDFIGAVLKLSPMWGMSRDWLLHFFRRMDERGDLRPRLRFRLGEAYAHFEAQRAERPEARALTEEQRAHFESVRDTMRIGRRWFEDPARAHPLETVALLDPYREPGECGPGSWDDHRVVVRITRPNWSADLYRYHMRAAYASWQVYHAWTLLERFTFRVLLDPMRVDPPDLDGSDWADDFGNRVRVRQRGDARAAHLAQIISADGWWSALARARAMVDYSEDRAREPGWFRWRAGEALDLDARWQVERPRVEERCAALAAPWATHLTEDEVDPASDRNLPLVPERVIPARFANRVRRLLELWRWATERHHGAFADALRTELHAAAEWAIFAFRTDFVTVDRDVGRLNDHNATCLAQALQPNRYEARFTIRDVINRDRAALNAVMGQVSVDEADTDRFLAHLDASELWAWSLELSRWARSASRVSDTTRDEAFLHLRSAALLFEPILGSLADSFGTAADRARIGTGTAKDPLKVFMLGRGGWRETLWQQLSAHYQLTTTLGVPAPDATGITADPSTLLIERIDEIDALDLPPSVSGPAKEILVLTATRNFGAHRFTRDAELTERYGGRIARAVLVTALFYWKVATTLG